MILALEYRIDWKVREQLECEYHGLRSERSWLGWNRNHEHEDKVDVYISFRDSKDKAW